MRRLTRLASIALAASSVVLMSPAVSQAAETTARAACYNIRIYIDEGSFLGRECHRSWGVQVTGTLTAHPGLNGCLKIETLFNDGGYRYATICDRSWPYDGDSKNINWSEGGATEAREYLSFAY